MRAKSNTALGLTYRDGSRLDTLSATVGGVSTSHAYTYQANSNLIATLVQKRGATTFLATTKTYDNLNRLSGISSASSAVSAAYAYNSANQRTKATREDNTYWNYHYDALGQVTSGKKFDAANTALNGLDYAWTFDDIGNRKSATTTSQISNYTSNNLNQYSQRTVPGIIDAFGAADAAATVTVALNGGAPQPTARQGELFFKQFTVDNSAVAQRPSLKITGVKNLVGPGGEDALTEITKTPYLPKTPEVFTYDADGNLTDDARWHYTWDAENRLAAMETRPDILVPTGPLPLSERRKLEFGYDGQSRRISKKVYNWNGTGWLLATSTAFLYDGWNLLAEMNALNSNAVVRTYVWGLDLSGSMEGAGGIGGLLAVNTGSATYAPTFDGGGNICGLVNTATGTLDAEFEYDPFGNVIRSTGGASTACPFGFSTRYTDSETGIVMYPLRPYYPPTGRFLCKDPIEEDGGINLYGFVGNDPVDSFDPLGLETFYGHELLDKGTDPFNADIPDFLANKLGINASIKGTIFWKKVRCCCSGSTAENVGKVRYIATLDHLKLSAKGKISLTKSISRMAPQKYRKDIESLLNISGVEVDVGLEGSGGLKLHYDQCQETGNGGGPIDLSASPTVSSSLGTKSFLSSEITGDVRLSGKIQVTHMRGVFSVTPQSFLGTANLNQEIFIAGSSVFSGGGSMELFKATGPFRSLKINARQWPWTTSVQ